MNLRFGSRAAATKILGLLAAMTAAVVLAIAPMTVAQTETQAEADIDDLVRRLVELMVESHPMLVSQREIVQAAEALPNPREGIVPSIDVTAGVGVELNDNGELVPVPALALRTSLSLFSTDRAARDAAAAFQKTSSIEQAKQRLIQIQTDLTNQLIASVDEILALGHRRRSQERLAQTLLTRRDQIEELVKAGLSQPSALWELDERLAGVEAEIGLLVDQRDLLLNRTAHNLGGAAWPRMLELLREIP